MIKTTNSEIKYFSNASSKKQYQNLSSRNDKLS